MRLPWQRPAGGADDDGARADPGRDRSADPGGGRDVAPDRGSQDRGSQDRGGPNRNGPDRGGQDRGSPNRGGQDRNGQDRGGQDRNAGRGRRSGHGGGAVHPDGGAAGFRDAVRQSMMSAAASTFGAREKVPPGRAERLGLTEVDPAASTALDMPHEFLRLGDSRRVGGEMAGYIGDLGARVFEFHADEFAPGRGGSPDGGLAQYSGFPYHVAAVELGYQLPWLAIAARRLHAPTQRLYPGRRGQYLRTPDRSANRGHVLHADGPGAADVLDAALRAWLADVLVMRIEHKTLATLEVSHGWALAAVQAHTLVRPDAGALAMQAYDPRRPGPWPDTLLGLLRNFRDRVPKTQRLP
jgi:hypothetical protein